MKFNHDCRIGLTFGMSGVVLLLICLLGALHVAAQVQTYSEISGTVSDATGAVVPGVTITLKEQNTGAVRTIVTGANGAYSFLSIPPGTYSVKASGTGFKTAEVTNRIAQVGQPARVDFTLTVGQSSQTVVVSASSANLIDTTTAEISGTIGRRMVSDLPLNGRNFADLAAMTPGSARSDALGGWNNRGKGQVSFTQTALMRVRAAGLVMNSGIFAAGNRDSASNVAIDGSNVQLAHFGETTQLQSPADIQEVKVESGTMSAEFGNGVTAVNIVTKSGTNQFHGEAYEFLRNDNLDATDYFVNLAGLKNPEYKMNQFGGAFGGPIIKDKLHFFANYEGLRVSQASFGQAAVPTANLRNGDFTTLGRFDANGNPIPAPTIYNPYRTDPVTGLREPFPGNVIPTGPTTLCSPRPTCIDPAMLAYLDYTPTPNALIDGIPEYVGTSPTTIRANQYTGRIDWEKSETSHIFGRFTYFKNYSLAAGLLPLQGEENPYGSINPTVSWVKILSPTSVNNLTVSYTRGTWGDSRASQGVGDVSSQIGLMNTSTNPGGAAITLANYTIASSGYSKAAVLQNTYQLRDDFSLEKGRHSLKFGFQSNERRVGYANSQFDKGVLSFQDLYSAACPLGNTACTTAMTNAGETMGGSALADYLLGTAQEAKLQLPGAVYNGNQRYYGVYAQDSWRVSQRLTVSAGLRYEYWSPWLNVRRMAARWDANSGTVVYALKNPLDYLSASTDFGRNAELTPGESPAGYTSGKKNFAPRGSLAYLLTPNTTLRAGAGIYFDGNTNQNEMSQIQGTVGPFGLFYDSVVAGNESAPPLVASDQFPVPSPTAIAQPSTTNPATVRVLGSNYYPTPTVYEWSASMQRALGKNWVAEVSYLGSHTIHEQQYVDLNIPDLPQGSLASLSLQQRRQFPDWAAVQSWMNIGWAKYESITTSIKAPNWNGLTFMSWFTWSKDMTTSAVGVSQQGNLDPRLFDIWAGPSLMNPALRNVNSWNYELPFGTGRRFALSGPLNWVAGGWAISGVAEFSQGAHQAVTTTDTSGTGQAYPMPDVVAGCSPNSVAGGKNRLEWFNPACFVNPAFGTYGTAKLGAFIEPGINNWNLALAKSFPIARSETNQVQFRADFFNAFNHTQWGFVDNALNSATVGQVLGTHPARQIQFSLKYLF